MREGNERLIALQERWDALREAKAALAREDYAAAMKTGVVLRKHRVIGSGQNAKEVTEYEINTALIESLNSMEKRAAIETGQEVDRADIKLRGCVNAEEELLKRAFTWEELSAMDARMRAAASGQVVVAKGLIAQEEQASGEAAAPREGTGGASTKSSESWRD